MTKNIAIPESGKPFKNRAAYCVGTGKMGLALQEEYQQHLEMVQEKINFKYIRGHGLFCDDVGIYREIEVDDETQITYNFTYLDKIVDSYLEKDIKPFLELGFMPEQLKTGEETIFWWQGNVSPPSSYQKWADLITAVLEHLTKRYGRKEVVTWPIEVWNEPNIGFWAGSMEEYFKLYDFAAEAIKKVDSDLQVGGPSICGVETEKWLRAFFEHCIEHDSPLDFITRHCYTANKPTRKGHYTYHSLRKPTVMIEELKETREIMDDYELTEGMPLHITEFNSSYSPQCPVHDTAFQAAYIARILSEAGEYADSYSYWTFSDVFEEQDIPHSVFHGGFGLVAWNSIKKPIFYTFEFFSRAGDELLYRDDHLLVTKKDDSYVIIGWNWDNPAEEKTAEEKSYKLELPSLGQQAVIVKKEAGKDITDPLQTWSNLGKPSYLNEKEKQLLQAAAEPKQTDSKLEAEQESYEVKLNIPLNQLCMLEILPVEDQTDQHPGFDKQEFYGLE